MSLSLFTFLRLFFCVYLVTSAAHAQSGVWNDHKLKMEFMKMNSKISYFEEKMDELTANNTNLVEKLKRSKEKENELHNEIDSIGKELQEVKRRDKRLELGVTEPYNYHLWNEYYKKEPDFSWVIDNWKSHLNQKPSWMLSPVFPLKGYPFGAQAKLTLEDNDYLHVSLSFKDISERKLDLKLVPAVYFIFKYQNTNKLLNAVQVIRSQNYLFTAKLNYDRLYYERRLIKSSKISNNTITINVHVEPPSIAERGISHNGTLTWAVDDFRKKMTMEQKNLVWYQRSPYFFTQPKGYKVQAYVNLNGGKDYKGIGLSFRIDFLTGPYDATLTTSFKYRTTLTLLHPTDPKKHITKSVDGDLNTKLWWEINMATNEEVEKLLHEDTLYYKVQIVAI